MQQPGQGSACLAQCLAQTWSEATDVRAGRVGLDQARSSPRPDVQATRLVQDQVRVQARAGPASGTKRRRASPVMSAGDDAWLRCSVRGLDLVCHQVTNTNAGLGLRPRTKTSDSRPRTPTSGSDVSLRPRIQPSGSDRGLRPPAETLHSDLSPAPCASALGLSPWPQPWASELRLKK